MRQLYFFLCITLFCITGYAQTPPPIDYTVRINAIAQTSPASINLSWKATTGAGNVQVYRKSKNAINWTPIATLGSTVTSYSDNSVSIGTGYEYYIIKQDPAFTLGYPYGYIYAGVETDAIHNRGALILLVDDSFSTTCNTEITTLMKDLSGDGWEVIRKDFSRSATVTTVKNFITSQAQANNNLSAVYILGHIAVPYSGDLNPDAHGNHKGAWPADGFYGDLDGNWTDNSVNNTSSANSLNHNIASDGKFDQSYFPSDIDLQVGRVDFYDMPAFGKSETEMMKSYLNKAHQYKTAALSVIKRGLIDDNFPLISEKFGSNGWRNFSPLVSIDSVTEKDLITTLNSSSYQWAYGCGGGSYTSCNGIGNTSNFTSNDVKSIFVILFGSYFGDWNYKNNFLRAPLCSNEPALASFWAGRPYWHLHHMALGETIGYATRLTQNNLTTYGTPSVSPVMTKLVSIALMGDPSLRTEYIQRVPSVNVSNFGIDSAIITWAASPEAGTAGYYVYRATSEFGNYELRSGLVSGTTFTDTLENNTTYWYMVRAAKIQQTPSGSYYNLSLGTTQSFNVGIKPISIIKDAVIYPNPAQDKAYLSININSTTTASISITDISSKVLQTSSTQLQAGQNTVDLNMTGIPAGMYMVNIKTPTGKKLLKLTKTY